MCIQEVKFEDIFLPPSRPASVLYRLILEVDSKSKIRLSAMSACVAISNPPVGRDFNLLFFLKKKKLTISSQGPEVFWEKNLNRIL